MTEHRVNKLWLSVAAMSLTLDLLANSATQMTIFGVITAMAPHCVITAMSLTLDLLGNSATQMMIFGVITDMSHTPLCHALATSPGDTFSPSGLLPAPYGW